MASPDSIQNLQSHHDILLIDNTYSTNRFNLPLMDIIGVDANKTLFNLIHPTISVFPRSISTD